MVQQWRAISSVAALSGGLWMPMLAAADVGSEPAPVASEATFQGASAAALEAPSTAASRPSAAATGVAGRLQLGLIAPLVRYTSLTTEGGDLPETTDSTVQWGAFTQAALELGYGVSDLIVIGGIVQLMGENISRDESSDSGTCINVGAKLDLQFGSGSRIKPFFGIVLGVGQSFTSSKSSSNASTSTEGSGTLFRAHARAGLRWFVTDDASIDAAIVGGFDTGGVTVKVSDRERDFDVSAASVGLSFGVSIWPDVS